LEGKTSNNKKQKTYNAQIGFFGEQNTQFSYKYEALL
jgi:hypothetical protein